MLRKLQKVKLVILKQPFFLNGKLFPLEQIVQKALVHKLVDHKFVYQLAV